MKPIFRFQFVFLVSLFLAACTSASDSSDRLLYLKVEIPPTHATFDKISDFAQPVDVTDWEESVAMIPSNDAYEFRQLSAEASCAQVELFDVTKNTPITLPDFIQQGDLQCLSSANQISSNGQWISYYFYDEVEDLTRFEIYNHVAKKRVVLDADLPPSSGRSCFWRADDLALACVSIYEKQPDDLEKTSLYVFELDEAGELEKSSSFIFPQDQMIHFVCGGVCVVDENDLIFSSEDNRILYKGHLEIVPDQFFSLKY